ncbi:MAG: cache domain-containing protein, partial [Syntrophobacteraceae bacterium]
MSRILNRGIGSRIFAGFVVQIAIGVLVGVAGFWSLRGVIDSSNLNQTAGEVQTRILQARALEKEYILKKDPQSYGNLIKTLDQLEAETIHLKNSMHQSGSADEIARTAQVYRGAAAQLKSLEESDAVVLQKLQMTATNIARMSEEESGKAARETAATIVEANAKTLKDTALKRIEDIVQTAHDVLKFHHERGLSFENALEVIRAMHFDGDNYFFVVGENLTLVAHGMDRGLEGLDFGTIQDKKTGKTFMKEVVDSAIKKGESYTEYYWTKPGQGEAIFPKITFGRYYKPWGVVICAGVYTEDIQAEIARTEALIKTGLKKLEDANAINANALNARLNAVYYFAFQQNADEVADYLQRLKSLPLATDALRAEADKYLADFQKRFEGNQKRQQEIQRIDEIAGRSTAAISEVSTMARDSASTSASSGKTFMMVFVFAGALGGIIIAILLLRAITGPIRKAISGVYSAAEQVLDASSQIADSSQQLAEGASEQASSLEETSSALEEMASM